MRLTNGTIPRGLVLALALGLPCWAGCGEARVPAMSSRGGPLPADANPAATDEAPARRGVGSAEEPLAGGNRRRQPVASSTSGAPVTLDITFDSIKFDMEKGEGFERSMLTRQIEALAGQPVRVRGYILPTSVFTQTGISQFVLVRDNLECCFGPGAALFDCIVVELKPEKTTDFTIRPVAVEGTFSIREILDPDGKHLAIYHLDGDAVE